MKARINFFEERPELLTGMLAVAKTLHSTTLDKKIMELAKYRASQLNGCAFCLDMHHKDAIHNGETEQRLHSLPAWQECPYYSDAERAALAYTDALTLHADADDATFTELSRFFSNKEIVDLTFTIALTTTWNRLNKAFRAVPGNYKVGQFNN